MSSIALSRPGATSPWGIAGAVPPLQDFRAGPATSAMDWGPTVTATLASIREEAAADGWDGDGSFAVAGTTIAIAAEVLAALQRLLPLGVPAPDVFAEADGQIGIEWALGPRLTYWISVSPDARVSFAGQFGSQGADHGWRSLDRVSPRSLDRSLVTIADHVQRLMSPSVRNRAA